MAFASRQFLRHLYQCQPLSLQQTRGLRLRCRQAQLLPIDEMQRMLAEPNRWGCLSAPSDPRFKLREERQWLRHVRKTRQEARDFIYTVNHDHESKRSHSSRLLKAIGQHNRLFAYQWANVFASLLIQAPELTAIGITGTGVHFIGGTLLLVLTLRSQFNHFCAISWLSRTRTPKLAETVYKAWTTSYRRNYWWDVGFQAKLLTLEACSVFVLSSMFLAHPGNTILVSSMLASYISARREALGAWKIADSSRRLWIERAVFPSPVWLLVGSGVTLFLSSYITSSHVDGETTKEDPKKADEGLDV